MPLVTHHLPEFDETKKLYIRHQREGLTHEQAQMFASVDRQRRKTLNQIVVNIRESVPVGLEPSTTISTSRLTFLRREPLMSIPPA